MIDLKKKFLIYGFGISGKSIEKYLKNRNCNYDIYDDYKNIRHRKVISKNRLVSTIKEYSYFILSPVVALSWYQCREEKQ